MSGVGMVAATYSPPQPPTSSGPLSCWVTFAPDAQTTFVVSGASSDLGVQGYGIVQYDYSGGTAPYSESLTIEGDPSGKLGIVPNGRGADTIAYTGFSLNEVEGGWLKYSVKDGDGATATARFPASGVLTITRTS